MKKVFWWLQAAVFYLFTWIFAIVPEQFVSRLGCSVGLLMHTVLGSRRRIAEQNISRTLEHMRSQPGCNCSIETPEGIAREVFKNLGCSLVEVCRFYHGRGDNLISLLEVRGRENLDEALARGKGVIFLTGHCGNWEMMALAYSAVFKSTMSVVARRQNNPYLHNMVDKMRSSYNNRVIYKDNAIKNIIGELRKNGVVGMLVDQTVLPEEGVLISFLGQKAWASKAPVLIARKTGAAILPAFIHRENGRHVAEIHPLIQFTGNSSDDGVMSDVQLYSKAIERFITEHPTDWYWVHRRWKRTEGL